LQRLNEHADQVLADELLVAGAVEAHQAKLGRTRRLVAAEAAFYSAKNEVAAKAKGVERFWVPNCSTKSAERKREQKKRWARNGVPDARDQRRQAARWAQPLPV
jgi:IS5 family transposase